MAHYDLENFDLLDYLTRNTVTFFNKLEETNLLQKKTINFFRGLGKTPLHERAATLKNFEKELEDLEFNRYESRAFLYLDILSWLRSKIYKKTLSQIIKDKMANQLNNHH
jgi:hypothetical protein